MFKPLSLFLLIGFLCFKSATAQDCTGGRYQNPIFPTVDSIVNVQYGSGLDQKDSAEIKLFLNIYYPANDTDKNRPLIILAHGGSFISGDKEEMTGYCKYLAQLGYVTATINYRLLNMNLVSPGVLADSASLKKLFEEAVYRSVWDMRSAVRFFRKTFNSNMNPYGIDPNIIIVGGGSAGGIMADLTTYEDQLAEVPGDILSFVNTHGGIEGNSGNSGFSSIPQLSISMCGAVNDTNIIQPGDQPFVGIHNLDDQVVPNISGFPNIGISVPVMLYGDSSIYKRTMDIGVPSAYKSFPGTGHCDFPVSSAEEFIANFLFDQICSHNLAVTKIPIQTSFSIYPNPAKNNFFIEIPQNKYSWKVAVVNMLGQGVLKSEIGEHQRKTMISTSSLVSGVYMVRLISDKGEMLQKKLGIR